MRAHLLAGALLVASVYGIGSAHADVGPAVGYMVGRCPGRGMKGLGMRSALAVVSGVAGFFVVGASSDFGQSGTDFATQNLGVAILVAGGLGLAASAVYDVSHARAIVREHCAPSQVARWEVAPVMLADRHSPTPGVALRVRLGS